MVKDWLNERYSVWNFSEGRLGEGILVILLLLLLVLVALPFAAAFAVRTNRWDAAERLDRLPGIDGQDLTSTAVAFGYGLAVLAGIGVLSSL